MFRESREGLNTGAIYMEYRREKHETLLRERLYGYGLHESSIFKVCGTAPSDVARVGEGSSVKAPETKINVDRV